MRKRFAGIDIGSRSIELVVVDDSGSTSGQGNPVKVPVNRICDSGRFLFSLFQNA